MKCFCKVNLTYKRALNHEIKELASWTITACTFFYC